MKPTSLRLLFGLAAAAALLTWAVVRGWQEVTGSLPALPWSSAVMVWVAAAGLLIAALALRPRLRRVPGHRPISPFVALRTAALAMAASRAGALLAGGYSGYLLLAIGNLDNAYRRQLSAVALVCLVGGVALAAAGLLLERFCRIPPQDSGQPGTASPA